MGGDIGSFASGFAETLLASQKRNTEEMYKKALIEQSKLNTKVLENKLKLAESEQQFKNVLLQSLGMGGGQPGATPAAAGGPGPAPGSGAPQGFQQGLVKDMAIKAAGIDLDAGFRKQGNVSRIVKIMTPQGPMQIALDQAGNEIGRFPAVPEYGTVTTKDPTGAEFQHFYDKTRPPMGGGVMTQPPAQALQRAPTSEEETKLRGLEGDISQLNDLVNFAKDPKNKDAFGSWAQFKHNTYQDESLTGGIGRSALGIVPPELGGGAPRPGVSGFLAEKQNFINKLRHGTFGGALTPQEAAEYRKESIASTTMEQFLAVAEKVKSKVESHYQRMNRDIQQPYGMRQKPSLNLGKQQITPQQAEQMLKQRGYKQDAQGNWVK